MNKKEFKKAMLAEGYPPKLVKIITSAAEEIYALDQQARALCKAGKTDEMNAKAKEVETWINGLQGFVAATKQFLTGEYDEE